MNKRLLEQLKKEIELLKNTPTPHSYWEKEDKILRERMEEREKINKSMIMSDSTYHRKFNI